MKLLIIGGTRFLGRALVDEARHAGHDVTLFNRGRSNPTLYRDIDQIHGDRDGELSKMAGRRWDAVIDTCGYVPRIVRLSAEFLADKVEHYTFISSISVYAEPVPDHLDESGTVETIADETTEELTGEAYGALKALCEAAATDATGGRALNVRAGLIVGPHDPTDRFTYWPLRVGRGGEVLAPGSPDLITQIIDVRDLAKWIILAAGKRLTGPYNVTGPETPLSIGAILERCRDVTGSDAAFTWVSEAFLTRHEVQPFTELPLWLPQESQGILRVSIDKALSNGLAFRPLEETVRDTLEWASSRASDYAMRNGLSPEKERALLAAWHESLS